MKSLIRWAIHNTPAMNTLMVAILVVGGVALGLMHREVFPEFELEIIMVAVPYPGASPEEIEEGICQKIEEAVQSVDGIKKMNSVAREGAGNVVLELEADVPDVQKVLNEVRSEIDRIPSFPELAEDPEIKQITIRREAIHVGVIGPDTDDPDGEVVLRNLAEQVRDELLELPSVSQAELIGARDYQIDVEIPEKTLRRYGLTLQDVARILKRENIEIPGGTMKTDLQEVLLRGKNKHEVGYEIAKIPLVTDPSGVVLTVGDLGEVRDEFVDVTSLHRINGRPGLAIRVDKTSKEDLMAITDEVREFVEHKQAGGRDGFELPDGYELTFWSDTSVMVRDRLSLLARNGLQGLILVFVVLAVFLEFRLAFWVALGIPISILGASAFMIYTGQTLNMLSMFAFLMALGIVVDDAIVIGENIYAHRQMGKRLVPAAVDGTVEVLPSVLASVTTTIIAFMPLMFVPGVMGKFIAVMPVVVIAMLVVSLIESTFILPCHLAHGDERQDEGSGTKRSGPVGQAWQSAGRFPWLIRWTFGLVWAGLVALVWFFLYPFVRISHQFNTWSSRILRVVIDRGYVPAIRLSLRFPGVVLAATAAFLMMSVGLILGGVVPFSVFPKLDANMITANIEYPDGTSSKVTEGAALLLEEAVWRVNEEYKKHHGEDVVVLTHRMVGQTIGNDLAGGSDTNSGSHVGGISVELVETEKRNISSNEIVSAWRKQVLQGLTDEATNETKQLVAGYESLTFNTAGIGPGGAPIEFKLLARPRDMGKLEEAVEQCKHRLAQYPGVFDIVDDSRPGKWEFQLAVKDDAKSMGVPLSELAGTVRAAYYGEEVMRLQRGRHEVKLMVRYPRNERRSLANFDDVRVRTNVGTESLVMDLAGAVFQGGNSANRTRAITDPATPIERPLTELAELKVERGYSSINRLDQQRAITIMADVDENEGNAQEIVNDLKANFLPGLFAEYPQVRVRWEGQQEQRAESVTGLAKGLAIALLVMFALLTLEFQTYLQPLLIMSVIPFGTIGAVAGHWVLGIPVSLFSLFGMVALTGVVVNDSIVLIDFMNRRVRSGMPLVEAILDAGRRRFRPVMLTSVTTIAALLPILLERSLQAQVVIPMATSLAFGLLFATLLVLVLVPTLFLIFCRYLSPATVHAENELMPSPELAGSPASVQTS